MIQSIAKLFGVASQNSQMVLPLTQFIRLRKYSALLHNIDEDKWSCT
jgi:hypothetical protein